MTGFAASFLATARRTWGWPAGMLAVGVPAGLAVLSADEAKHQWALSLTLSACALLSWPAGLGVGVTAARREPPGPGGTERDLPAVLGAVAGATLLAILAALALTGPSLGAMAWQGIASGQGADAVEIYGSIAVLLALAGVGPGMAVVTLLRAPGVALAGLVLTTGVAGLVLHAIGRALGPGEAELWQAEGGLVCAWTGATLAHIVGSLGDGGARRPATWLAVAFLSFPGLCLALAATALRAWADGLSPAEYGRVLRVEPSATGDWSVVTSFNAPTGRQARFLVDPVEQRGFRLDGPVFGVALHGDGTRASFSRGKEEIITIELATGDRSSCTSAGQLVAVDENRALLLGKGQLSVIDLAGCSLIDEVAVPEAWRARGALRGEELWAWVEGPRSSTRVKARVGQAPVLAPTNGARPVSYRASDDAMLVSQAGKLTVRDGASGVTRTTPIECCGELGEVFLMEDGTLLATDPSAGKACPSISVFDATGASRGEIPPPREAVDGDRARFPWFQLRDAIEPVAGRAIACGCEVCVLIDVASGAATTLPALSTTGRLHWDAALVTPAAPPGSLGARLVVDPEGRLAVLEDDLSLTPIPLPTR